MHARGRFKSRTSCELPATRESFALPAAAEEPAELSPAGVRAKPWTARGILLGQSRDPLGVERQRDEAGRDPGDLGGVDEPLAGRRVEHEAVEDVLGLVLEDGAHAADVAAVAVDDRRPALEDLVGDRVVVVV